MRFNEHGTCSQRRYVNNDFFDKFIEVLARLSGGNVYIDPLIIVVGDDGYCSHR